MHRFGCQFSAFPNEQRVFVIGVYACANVLRVAYPQCVLAPVRQRETNKMSPNDICCLENRSDD